MIRLINLLFEENNFNTRNLVSIPVTNIFAEEKNRANYYLALFFDESNMEQFSIEMFNDQYNAIKGLEEGYDPQMDKNLSLLLCVKRNSLQLDPIMNKTIFDIEEDPYFFKKYVLTYTDSQVNEVLQKQKETTIMEYIHRTLSNEEAFQEYKLNPHLESEYNLVSKMFIKIPFLNLKKMDRELSSLKNDITNSLSISLLKLRDDLVKLQPSEKVEDEIISNLLFEYIGVKKV
jgi:hypothetical protein